MVIKNSLIIGLTMISICLPVLAQTSYNGNGDTGFNGSVGNGNLVVSDDGTSINFKFTPGASLNDDLVIYIDSIGGGFSSTSGFNDTADGGRKAISGYNGPGQQSILNFATGFSPDYAIDIGSSFAGLFGLNNGGSGSLNYITGASQIGSPYSLTVPLADLGLTPGAAQSFGLFGTLISESGYRSTEALAGNDSGAAGWGNTMTQTSFASYITVVPEPSTVMLGMSGLAGIYLFRRRR